MTDKLAVVPSPLNPQALIAAAIDKGASIETLERLVNLAKDIRQVTAREAYFDAMATFKSECPRIKKDATANAGQYSYNYATLDGILDVVDPLLGKVGLTVSWRQKHEGSAVHASCVITHKLGHQEESGFIAIPFEAAGRMNPAQRVGSAATYAKRYSLLAILGLAPEDDDDARSTGSRESNPLKEERPTQSSPHTRGSSPVSAPPAQESAASQDPNDPALVVESERLFVMPDVVRDGYVTRIRKFTDSKIKVALHRVLSVDPEMDWTKLDVAALDTLARHLEPK